MKFVPEAEELVADQVGIKAVLEKASCCASPLR